MYISACLGHPAWVIWASSWWLTVGWTHHQVGVKGDFALVLWHLCSDPVWMLRGCLLLQSVWVVVSTQALVFMAKLVSGCEVPGWLRGLEPIKACLELSIGCLWHNQFTQRKKHDTRHPSPVCVEDEGNNWFFKHIWICNYFKKYWMKKNWVTFGEQASPLINNKRSL